MAETGKVRRQADWQKTKFLLAFDFACFSALARVLTLYWVVVQVQVLEGMLETLWCRRTALLKSTGSQWCAYEFDLNVPLFGFFVQLCPCPSDKDVAHLSRLLAAAVWKRNKQRLSPR